MSLSVSRRKSRRKLPHQGKNLDEVLQTTQSATSFGKKRNSGTGRGSGTAARSQSYCSEEFSSSQVTSSGCWSKQRGDDSWYDFDEEEDDYLDLEKITFRLGELSYAMDQMGNWTARAVEGEEGEGVKGVLERTTRRLVEENEKLEQENNMLRVKNELLVDMVARKTVKKEKLEKELTRLRKIVTMSSSRFSMNSN